MSFSVPGIPVFQCVYVTVLPLVHTNSSIFFWFDSPSQKCFSGLKPTKLIRNALSTLEICKQVVSATFSYMEPNVQAQLSLLQYQQ